MFPYSGDLIELAIRGVLILAIGHLLVTLLRHRSASLRAMLMAMCLSSLLALPLMWVSLPKWEALPQEMTVMPYFPMQLPAISQDQLAEKSVTTTDSNTTTPATTWTWGQVNAGVTKIWQLGLVLCICPLVLGLVMLRRVAKLATPVIDEAWHQLLAQCMNRLAIKQHVLLLQSDKHTMPMTWGWWRAKLLIPTEANDWPMDKRRVMLLHELAHIKRRDCLLAAWCQIACAMHWFNPLAWWALKRLRNLREEACDNVVLGVMEQDKASDYAQHLLDIAANLHSPVLANHASIAMARKSSLENRLLAILDPRKHRANVTRRVLVMLVLLIGACAIPLTMLRAGETTITDALEHDTAVEDIFAKVIAKYQSMNTFKAEGTAISDIDTAQVKVKVTTSFSMAIKKPNQYLITWSQVNNIQPSKQVLGAVWSDGTQPFLYMGAMDAYTKMNSDETAIGGATGVSGGVAYTVPSMMLSAFEGSASPFDQLENPSLETTQTIADDPCYVISGSSIISKKETFWISKSNYLIRKYSRSLEPSTSAQSFPEFTEEQLNESAKAMGMEATEENRTKIKEMMTASRETLKKAKLNGTMTEIYTSVSSPTLNKEDFAYSPPTTAQRNDALFGEIFNQPTPPPTTQPSQPIRPKPVNTYVPTRPDWEERFNQVYRLDDDEVIRFIPKPFIPERLDYYNITSPDQADAIPQGPNSMVFQWGEHGRKNHSMAFGRSVNQISYQMTNITDLYPFELTGDLTLLELDLPGDWIIRPDQTLTAKLTALETIINQQTHQGIHFQQKMVQRQVIVAKGGYHFSPTTMLKDIFGDISASNHIYSQTATDQTTSGGGSGNLDKFLKNIGIRINMHVINETDYPVPHKISWTNHHDSYYGNMGEDRNKKIDQLLSNVGKQTHLLFFRETRTVPVWEISKQ